MPCCVNRPMTGMPRAQSEAASIDRLFDCDGAGRLGEIGNITFGSAATALSTLLGKKVDITTPTVSMITREQFDENFLSRMLPYM